MLCQRGRWLVTCRAIAMLRHAAVRQLNITPGHSPQTPPRILPPPRLQRPGTVGTRRRGRSCWTRPR